MADVISGDDYVTKNGSYLYAGKELDWPSVKSFITHNEGRARKFKELYDLYTGDHAILKNPADPKSARPDNRLVSNWANYVVDTYVGYFIGKPPKITLDEEASNQQLQNWFSENSFIDKLAEVTKQVAIYGCSYMLGYQDETSKTRVAVVEPSSGFMIYDTSINRKPLAFVRYSYFNNQLQGDLYNADGIQPFTSSGFTGDKDSKPFGAVPAIEFVANDERLSLVGKIKTLVEAYDSAFSQKANQVAYFDAAYLAILGINLKKDKNGDPVLDIDKNKVIYAPSFDSSKGKIEFLSKPDGDTMQENMLNRLKDDIFQTAMVANLSDEAFSGNSSGVAIRYKLLAMQNQAAFEVRKFTIALRNLLGALLGLGQIIGTVDDGDKIKQDLNFHFNQNIPEDIASEVQAASAVEGIVSKETQLGLLPFVDDPKAEIKRMQDEQEDKIKNAVKNQASATDILKGGNNGENTEESEKRGLLGQPGQGGSGLDSSKPSQR
ncbi:MAG: phage portal protein [Limosilactobacillus oris]|jgi:SPP1 family phage portal protein|uniref:phage portal protein n=1 Tax=Limosilactobacillus oris TaxID=1632 RepID=UPI002432FF99|nr:phage portal protein [Limosilactobacillus oris]MCH3911491.1 phage portal protein [Limosilactobacillus oris]MCH3938741.1 phage portal protein [Limosilactobacillus oris]MCI1980131.1 phage portal protein [Limosilactobacillus oris]MCI2042889.1 phage portal protein [Limosilactobacillus oris]